MDLGGKSLLSHAYPPFFLFYILPLGILSYYATYILWAFGTLALYFVMSFDGQERTYTPF